MTEENACKRQAEIKLRDKIETALRAVGDDTEYAVDVFIHESHIRNDGKLAISVTLLVSAREKPDCPTDPRADAVLAGWPTEL